MFRGQKQLCKQKYLLKTLIFGVKIAKKPPHFSPFFPMGSTNGEWGAKISIFPHFPHWWGILGINPTSNKQYFKIHLANHTREETYKCDLCDKLFFHKKAFKRHMVSHTQKNAFKCDVCGNCFSEKCNLKRHLKTHAGVKPFFKCGICEQRFALNSYLKDHLKIHATENENGEAIKCDFCDKVFSRKRYLKQHLIVHTGGEKSFKCVFCNKTWPRKRCLEQHLKMHTGLLEKKPLNVTFVKRDLP